MYLFLKSDIFLYSDTYFLCWRLFESSPRGVVANELDCDIVVSEFEIQLHHYVHFQTNAQEKGMNPLILIAMG